MISLDMYYVIKGKTPGVFNRYYVETFQGKSYWAGSPQTACAFRSYADAHEAIVKYELKDVYITVESTGFEFT